MDLTFFETFKTKIWRLLSVKSVKAQSWVRQFIEKRGLARLVVLQLNHKAGDECLSVHACNKNQFLFFSLYSVNVMPVVYIV